MQSLTHNKKQVNMKLYTIHKNETQARQAALSIFSNQNLTGWTAEVWHNYMSRQVIEAACYTHVKNDGELYRVMSELNTSIAYLIDDNQQVFEVETDNEAMGYKEGELHLTFMGALDEVDPSDVDKFDVSFNHAGKLFAIKKLTKGI